MKIEVNKTIPDSHLSIFFIKKVLKKALEFLKKDISLSIVLVDKKTIRFLNKKYRKKDRSTDVLSFNYSSDILKSKKGELFGEIIICWPVIKEQAKFYQVDLKEELARVVVHGLLHLFGYDHEKKKEKKIMDNKTDKIIREVFK